MKQNKLNYLHQSKKKKSIHRLRYRHEDAITFILVNHLKAKKKLNTLYSYRVACLK